MIDIENNYIGFIKIQSDYEKSENCGEGGMFKVINVEIETDDGKAIDLTNKIDQGKLYHSAGEVIIDLGYSPDEIDYKLV